MCNDIEGIFINWEWDEPSQSCLTEDSILAKQFETFRETLQIPKSVLHNGIAFVSTPKSLILEMIQLMESLGFNYIENIVVCQMKKPTQEMIEKAGIQHNLNNELENSDKENITNNGQGGLLGKRVQPCITNFFGMAAKPPAVVKKIPFQSNPNLTQVTVTGDLLGSKADKDSDVSKENLFPVNGKIDFARLKKLQVDDAFMNNSSIYLQNTKKTFLMFRKFHPKLPLELRHQRNPDAFFDIFYEGLVNGMDDKGKERLYKLIETLLPKAINSTKGPRLLEINGSKPRNGWITICKNHN